MKNLLSNFVYFSHFGVGFFWCGLFFLPTTWWPDKISFQFFLTITIIGHQFLWGGFIKFRTGKFRPTCFLTTIAQRLRGFPISSPENYNYSFTKEIFRKIGIPLPQKAVPALAFVIFVVVTIQYFLYN